MSDLPLVPSSEAFPAHVFDARGLPPRVHDERIGGSVLVVEKDLPEGSVLLATAGVSRLPVGAGLPVELAVEVPHGQEGAGLIALRLVCDDVAHHRRTPPVGSPWRSSQPFLLGTRITAIVATSSRWGDSFDEVREADGTLAGHVRTLRLLTDGEAAVVATHGWDGLLERAGSLERLLDVTREGVVDGHVGPNAGGGDAAGSAAPAASGPPRDGSVVMLSRLHEQHPPRWLTFEDGVFHSVTGRESPEYMADSGNHTFWSRTSYLARFPWTEGFTSTAQEGQTAVFTDASGAFTLED
ncbi:suppressor of fused domain protein [Serinibacter arcticus]|uniref:suppressor of fused domain protein n=1 Tax=Serinibacter arcticus TaxID=1655435 RepID=UPI001E3EAF96|nr:suppressor of fused domain protein [Serinibacter arcticus]